MSNALFAEVDAEIFAGLADVGLADVGSYQPAIGVAQACSVIVDRDSAAIELQGVQAHAGVALVAMRRDGIAVPPARGARITIGGEVLTVDALLSTSDDSLWRLVCHS